MQVLFLLILFAILGIVVFFLYTQVKESREQGRPFWYFGDYTLLAWSLIVLSLCYSAFNLFRINPVPAEPEAAAAYGSKTAQPWVTAEAYRQLIVRDSLQVDYYFGWISSHFDHAHAEKTKDIRAYDDDELRIFLTCTRLSEHSTSAELRDIGNLGLGLYYMYREQQRDDNEIADYGNARGYLRQVKNTQLKYLNYAMGVCMLRDYGAQVGEFSLNREIELNGYRAGAWNELGWIYLYENRHTELAALAYDAEKKHALDFSLRRRFYYEQRDVVSFYTLYFADIFKTLNLLGLLGALFIGITWVVFLRQLAFIAPLPWKHILLTVFIGFVMAMGAWWLYAIYEYSLDFSLSYRGSDIANDALYCFLGIGVIEELLKLIPFLIILYFTNIIQKPIHYLLVAAFSALGFAFFENLLYISQEGVGVIHGRALMSAVAHMVSGALVAYGFILARYRYRGISGLWVVPLLFVLAALAHGFYDFWLINEKVKSLYLLTFLFYLSEVLVLASLLNNALNQSVEPGTPEPLLALNTGRLTSILSGSLVLVFVYEFAALCTIYGTEYGNQTLFSAFITGGYLIFFLSVRLPNIDIVPGEWAPIEFFSSLLPAHLGNSRKKNFNLLVGMEFTFSAVERPGPLTTQLPREGRIIRREKINGNNAWFVVELYTPITINETEHRFIIISSKETGEMLSKEHDTVIAFCLLPGEETADKQPVFVDWAIAH